MLTAPPSVCPANTMSGSIEPVIARPTGSPLTTLSPPGPPGITSPPFFAPQFPAIFNFANCRENEFQDKLARLATAGRSTPEDLPEGPSAAGELPVNKQGY